MIVTEHSYHRGKHNAEARLDRDGIVSAIEWLAQRQADTEKPCLDSRYIKGYQDAINRCRRWCEEDDLPTLACMAMWSLVWIATGGGLGDDPTYKAVGECDVWRSWKESQ